MITDIVRLIRDTEISYKQTTGLANIEYGTRLKRAYAQLEYMLLYKDKDIIWC